MSNWPFAGRCKLALLTDLSWRDASQFWAGSCVVMIGVKQTSALPRPYVAPVRLGVKACICQHRTVHILEDRKLYCALRLRLGLPHSPRTLTLVFFACLKKYSLPQVDSFVIMSSKGAALVVAGCQDESKLFLYLGSSPCLPHNPSYNTEPTQKVLSIGFVICI